MASLDDGYYIIHSAAVPSIVLSKQGNGVTNGTNICVADIDYTPAQIVRVLTMADGTRRILFRDCGKAVDVIGGRIFYDDSNVQIFEGNDTAAQKVGISGGFSNTTYNGVTYENRLILWESHKAAKATGTNHGDNVVLASVPDPPTSNMLWFFEPIPQIRDGQSYRILSMLNTDYCLEIAGSSAANGANVKLGKYNSQPNQVWVFESTLDGWAIRNPRSGYYMDVAGGVPQDRTNVQIWDDNDTRAQRWNLIGAAATVYQGKTYSTHKIGSYVTQDGATYLIDVENAEVAANTNVQLWTANGNPQQVFLLIPTDVEDPTLPVPFDLSFADAPGDAGQSWMLSQEKAFPTWACSGSWTTYNADHFEFRFRRRYMYSHSDAWTSWAHGGNVPGFTDWAPAYTYNQGNRAWLAEGIDSNIASEVGPNVPTKWDWWKHGQIELQVRSMNGEMRHSKTITETLDIYMVPDVTISSNFTWSPKGLTFTWTSDYTFGTTYLTINSIALNSGEILKGKYRVSGTKSENTATIPLEAFTRFPSNNATTTIKFNVGYDQFEQFPTTYSATKRTNYASGTTSVTIQLDRPSDKLDVTVMADADDTYTWRCWMIYGGNMYECMPTSRPGSGYYLLWDTFFRVPYPMRASYQLYYMKYNSDYSSWGIGQQTVNPEKHIAHGFIWNGGSCYLHKFEGALPTTETTYSPIYEANALDSRPRESISFSPTTSTTYTVTGALMHDGDYSTLDDVKALLEAGHVIYRDVNGGVHHVAITGITATQREKYDTVTVSMTEETI